VIIAFYRPGREAGVAGIGEAAAVNGILSGAIIGVKEGEEVLLSKGGNDGLDRPGPLHGVGGGWRGGLGAAVCEEEVALIRCKRRRKREAGRLGGPKRPNGSTGY
jgi:hypothetical protein